MVEEAMIKVCVVERAKDGSRALRKIDANREDDKRDIGGDARKKKDKERQCHKKNDNLKLNEGCNETMTNTAQEWCIARDGLPQAEIEPEQHEKDETL